MHVDRGKRLDLSRWKVQRKKCYKMSKMQDFASQDELDVGVLSERVFDEKVLVDRDFNNMVGVF